MGKTSTEARPLQGDTIYSLKITGHDPRNPGVRTLAHRWHAFEFEQKDFVETYSHPIYPGINVIFLHEAWEGDTIESARARNPHAQEFLLSKLGSKAIIASSCMGYHETGSVRTYTDPSSVIWHEDVNYVDFSVDELNGSNPSLVTVHANRVRNAGGDISHLLPQDIADEAFRHIIAGAREVR